MWRHDEFRIAAAAVVAIWRVISRAAVSLIYIDGRCLRNRSGTAVIAPELERMLNEPKTTDRGVIDSALADEVSMRRFRFWQSRMRDAGACDGATAQVTRRRKSQSAKL